MYTILFYVQVHTHKCCLQLKKYFCFYIRNTTVVVECVYVYFQRGALCVFGTVFGKCYHAMNSNCMIMYYISIELNVLNIYTYIVCK